MFKIFTDSGPWGYIILFCEIILVSTGFYLCAIPEKHHLLERFSFVITIPTATGIAGTLIGYHVLIDTIISEDVPVDLLEEAERFVSRPLYIGVVGSLILIPIWLKKFIKC